ncbi:hypothetical protein CCY99_01630 [Helicobacter sp. 16-1353]|uniref:plasminogen-binding protein n=1 Tax=Helicobacter sp. 16-1353 TaxID=2004996 RepID=UPI000DCC1439|nr:plasminogen-binding protein [Helicobacter sp. 16-1353]RAX54873.1 hypothetical protein CCY99_01630 [Helicobacter sp. 16-1353]
MNRIFTFSIFIFIIFVGCSEKKYFTPDKNSILGEIKVDGKLDSDIYQSNKNGAVLKNGTLITKDGIYQIKLKDNFSFLNTSGDLLLVANYDDNTLFILNKDGKELKSFPFDYMPISASLRDNILAVVLADNTSIIWDINVNELLFSHKSPASYAINSKAASPLFLDTTIIFPTFDGKIILVSLDNFKIIRTIALGSGIFFNNVIYLALEGENLIVATNNKLMTLISGEDFSYDVNISDVLYTNNKIYVLSLEGEVIELDLLLNELNKKKFPFATLNSIIVKDNIYTLESQGYMIKIDKNNFIDSIYKIDIDEYKDSFYTDDVIYYDNKIIRFPK